MSDLLLVAVLHSLEQNDTSVACFLLVVVRLLHDAVKKLSAHHLFRHEIIMLLLIKNIIQANNVWMLQLLKDVNLVLESDLVFMCQL